MNYRRWFKVGGLFVLIALTGCNFSSGDQEKTPKPTLGSSVAQATDRIVTATLSGTGIPTPEAALTSAPPVPATTTPTSVPPTFTPSPSRTPVEVIPTTAVPVLTSVPTASPVPSTPTPVVADTQVSPATTAPSAQVSGATNQLRLRDAPGTAGKILTTLETNTPMTIIGRTSDNTWAQVVLADGRNGWVATQYLTVNIDLNVVSVTGKAQNAMTAAGLTNTDVVSGVSSNARKIFLDGRAKGNLAHVFTRVGDSISASPNFLTPLGYGSYNLANADYLGDAISFFSGPNGRGQNPFAAASIAARNGWSTESVLNPANADPGVCAAGETPLACEYRVNKPAVALIMFGTNDSGGMPTETFRANLQTIVQVSINMGVIPVLSTIPPKHYNAVTDGRVAEFNQVIIATAQAYDVPLLNYWLAMSRLPGEGLAADGVHPSEPPDGQNGILDAAHLQYGYPTRNLTALQMLYILWQQVLYDGDQAPAATAPPSSGVPSGGNPSDPACQGTLPPQLTVGGQGRVTPGLPNKIRSQAGTGAAQIGAIPGESVFQVMAGPSCVDGLWWWQVNYNGLVGWTANGNNSEYWVQPYP